MTKAPHNEELSYSYCKLVEVVYKALLTHAKLPEYVAEDLFGVDFADDFADVEDCFADVLG